LFPKPVKLGAGANAWPESEIAKYLEDRIAARDAEFSAVDNAARSCTTEGGR
jgi:Prophage CP4-57 regulatory protein (AlpA)